MIEIVRPVTIFLTSKFQDQPTFAPHTGSWMVTYFFFDCPGFWFDLFALCFCVFFSVFVLLLLPMCQPTDCQLVALAVALQAYCLFCPLESSLTRHRNGKINLGVVLALIKSKCSLVRRLTKKIVKLNWTGRISYLKIMIILLVQFVWLFTEDGDFQDGACFRSEM